MSAPLIFFMGLGFMSLETCSSGMKYNEYIDIMGRMYKLAVSFSQIKRMEVVMERPLQSAALSTRSWKIL